MQLITCNWNFSRWSYF